MQKREIINGKLIRGNKTVKIRRDSEDYDIELTHANLLNSIFADKNDAMRMFMMIAFSKACVPLINPELPLIASTYLKDINRNNFYVKRKKNDFTILSQIFRDIRKDGKDQRFTLIYEEDGKICLHEHKRHQTFGEGVSQYNQTNTDNYIYKTKSFTETGELMTGLNTMVAYINTIDAIEDSSIISESYSNKNKYLYVKDISIEIKDNVIFTSDKDPAFPEFDYIKKDKIGIAYNSDKNYSSIILPDVHYHRDNIRHLPDVGCFLGEMDVYYNIDLLGTFKNPILNTIMQQDYEYNKAIYDVVNKERMRGKKLDISVTKFIDDFEYRFIEGAILRDGDTDIDKLRIDFYFYQERRALQGQKLSASYGNKVTVGYISPDAEMYTDEYGRVADLAVPGCGIINRSNPGQNYEPSVTHLAWVLIKNMIELKFDDRKFQQYIIKFANLVCVHNGKAYHEQFKQNPSLVNSLKNLGYIVFKLNPFKYTLSNENFGELVDLVMSVNPEKYKEIDDLYLKFYKNGKYIGKGIMAPMYIMRAKQEALSKLSNSAINDEGSDGTNKKTQTGQSHSNNPVKSSEKDKANEASIMNSRETRIFEDKKDKMTPAIAYWITQGFRIRI